MSERKKYKSWEELDEMLRPTETVEIAIRNAKNERVVRETRTYRKSQKALIDLMPGDLYQAYLEIGKAIYYYIGGISASKTTLSNLLLPVRQAHENYEEPLWKLGIVNTYKQWAKEIVRSEEGCAKYGIVYEFVTTPKGIREVAQENHMRDEKVKRYLREGLNEYCLLRGWPDQLNDT